MTKQIRIVAILLYLPFFLFSQTGKVFDNLSMTSRILKSDRKYAVYLPPDYEASQRQYPVLYLLHGSGDDQTGWVQFGEVLSIADKAIIAGSATPMIIVMPDANTGRRGYFNDVKGDWAYEDFFFQEFLPFIEKNTGSRRRSVSGLLPVFPWGVAVHSCMPCTTPELFSSACPLSASARVISLDSARVNLKRDNPQLSETEITTYYNRHSALTLINSMPDDHKKQVRWYFDCGDDDFLYEGNALIHIAMRKKEIPHEFRVRDGGHSWSYWRTSLPAVLEFVSQAFHQF